MPLLHNSNHFRIHQNFSTSFAMILYQKMYSASLEHILHWFFFTNPCELKYENKTYIITNVYCPNDSGVRKTFIRDIDPYVIDGSLTEKMHSDLIVCKFIIQVPDPLVISHTFNFIILISWSLNGQWIILMLIIWQESSSLININRSLSFS
jgi:hypothetical protein